MEALESHHDLYPGDAAALVLAEPSYRPPAQKVLPRMDFAISL